MQNFMKTIISAVQTWTKGEIKDSTADWNENDSSADSYVKNRTHWEEMQLITLLPEMTVVIEEDGGGYVELSSNITRLTIGQEYHITLNGVEYACVAREWNEDDSVTSLIGNGTICGDGNEGNGEPFSCDSYEGGSIYLNAAVGEYTISISTSETVVHKIDPKYLDLPTNLATIDDVNVAKQEAVDVANAAKTTANTAMTNAITAQTTADSKMNAINPVGTGSFSMNRKTGTTVGDYSHAEGYHTTASNYYSHAEGYSTTASGEYSHAEGCETTASGSASHVEGEHTEASGSASHAEGSCTTASGEYSHAEGEHTEASGSASHAEGYHTTASKYYSHAEGSVTEASGYASHAEGSGTTASGKYSHAEGYATTASSISQHVQGEFNILDGYSNARGTYAHIVGNGTSGTARSNAHTLDWNGVGWYQGGLQVGGNAQDDGAKNVLLEGDAIPVPVDTTVGQTIVVKSVDENGKPTEWEAVDPMVITSSTEGSNKKFKITVDDTGTLTVSEIVVEEVE